MLIVSAGTTLGTKLRSGGLTEKFLTTRPKTGLASYLTTICPGKLVIGEFIGGFIVVLWAGYAMGEFIRWSFNKIHSDSE